MTQPLALVFVFDQLSPLSLPCYGNFLTQTPELDRFCSQSLIFHEYYPQAIRFKEGESPKKFLSVLSETQEIPGISFKAELKSCLESETNLDSDFVNLSLEDSESEQKIRDLLEEKFSQPVHSSAGSLIFVSINSGESSDLDKLDWLEQVLLKCRVLFSESHEESVCEDRVCADSIFQREILLAISSEKGGVAETGLHESAEQNTPFSSSLSSENWAPLIVNAPGLCGEFGKRWNSLATSFDLVELLILWLKSSPEEKQTRELFSNWFQEKKSESSSAGRLLLQSLEKLGLRTEEDLLVVPRESFLLSLENQLADNENAEIADSQELYLKPDDRFDVNDVSSSYPELVQKRWDELSCS